MHYTLIAPKNLAESASRFPQNAGYGREAVVDDLQRRREHGEHTFQIIDTDDLDSLRLSHLYMTAAAGSRRKVHRTFKSGQDSGGNFGRNVPALLVAETPDAFPSDVYPHERQDSTFATIVGYLAETT